MPGLQMNVGLGGAHGGGGYSGPVFGADGAASVPMTGGYPDTAPGRAMTFGPGQMQRGGQGNPTVHALGFGILCFAGLLFFAWCLPR